MISVGPAGSQTVAKTYTWESTNKVWPARVIYGKLNLIPEPERRQIV